MDCISLLIHFRTLTQAAINRGVVGPVTATLLALVAAALAQQDQTATAAPAPIKLQEDMDQAFLLRYF